MGFQFLLILFNSVLGRCVQGRKCMTALLADKETMLKAKQKVGFKKIFTCKPVDVELGKGMLTTMDLAGCCCPWACWWWWPG